MSSPTNDWQQHSPSLGPRAKRANLRRSATRGLGLVALLGALALVGVFIAQTSFFAPPKPQEVNTKIDIARPDEVNASNSTITGLDRNQRPFTIHAAEGQQDKLIKTLVHLQTVDGAFERPSGDKLKVTSNTAKYDTKSKALILEGNVVFAEPNRLRAVMQRATVDMNTQALQSEGPVQVDMNGTKIEAQSLSVTENGTRILFKGGVKAHFVAKPKTTGEGG